MSKILSSRSEPIQGRARLQRDKILKETCSLLKTVGLSELTTILVAKKLNISVGTLYHYFPNKHAILFALSDLWLENIMQAMDNISSEDIEKMQLKPFVSLTVESLLEAYKANTFLLPIVPVMATTPELKSIYDTYLNTVHGLFMGVFERLTIAVSDDAALHLPVIIHQICHTILFNLSGDTASDTRSIADLKYLLLTLLERERLSF
ncbi:MAG: TetR/AcrR family transcriptional regulator [Cellvibrionales bacterium TMED47]|nr:TetR family transcriptional regulator [Porticoccaceae bacterium]RPG85224.1 MAG: TetR/AcrR family transcriptional regulator [Cellvibrionales bacterium TMED47]